MKKTILALLTVTCCFFACKKNNRDSNTGSTTGNGKTYPITFSLNPNSLASSPLDTAFTNHVKTIAYALYDSNGKQIEEILQDSTFSNFGTISTHAQAGTYYAYFMANSGYVPGASPYFYPNDPGNKDVFYRKDTIVINNAAVNQNIIMGRTTARLVINIEDVIPQNVSSIVISPGTVWPYKMLDTSYSAPGTVGHFFISSQTHTFTPAEKGKKDVKISMIIYNPDVLHDVSLTIYSPNLQPAFVKIKDVKFIRNHITTLSGVVFSPQPTLFDSGFKISINTDWNTHTIGF